LPWPTSTQTMFALGALAAACTLVLGSCAEDERWPLRLDKECMRLSCRSIGYCTFDAALGVCVPRGDDCAQTERCFDSGACTVVASGGAIGVCLARSSDDCARSIRCRERGYCEYNGNGFCAQDAGWSGSPTCATSLQCLLNGQCAGSYPRCATDDSGCARSLACKETGGCAPYHSLACGPATEAHCRASDRCADFGLCGFRQGVPACLLGSDADCRASWRCRSLGACAVGKAKQKSGEVTEACVVTSSADCAASYGCLYHGKCKLVGDIASGTSECG
jgi:hypothetical protein